MEAYEGYWRKMPSVKRLVYKSVPEATTRMAMLKRGEVDLAYLLDAPQAQDIKKDPSLKLAFSGGIGTYYLDYFDQWDPKSPWHDRRVRLAASHALDRQALSEAETLGASRPNGSLIPRKFEFALPLDPHPYDPAKAKQLLAEAGYPNGFDAGELYPWPPYTSMGEAVGGYLGAVGIKVRIRTMERAAFYTALESKKLKGLCVCINAVYGNAASRMAQTVPSDGAFAYGGYPDVDALYKQQSPRDRPAQAGGAAPPDPAPAPRAGALRADHGLHLAERRGPPGGRARADADRSLPVVGAPGGRPAQEVGRQRERRGQGLGQHDRRLRGEAAEEARDRHADEEEHLHPPIAPRPSPQKSPAARKPL